MGTRGETGDMGLSASQQLSGHAAMAKSLVLGRSICSVGSGPKGPECNVSG